LNDYNDSTSETVTVSGPDLQLTKDDGGVTSFAGGVVAYTVDYQNVGNGGATGVVIQDTVPANTTFNPGASTPGWTCLPDNNAGSLCTFIIGNFGAGASSSAVFAVTVDDPLPAGVIEIDNTATITDDGNSGPEPTPGDNSDNDTTPVTAVPDLSVTKDDGRTIIGQGTTLVYVLTYANLGDQEATGVELTDTVPAATTFLPGSSTPGWSCVPDNNAGSACTFDLGSVAVGGGGSVAFSVVVDDPVALGTTQIVNTVTIDDDGTNGPDANPLDNTASDTDNLMLASALTKTLIDTNQTHTGGTDAAIGEILTYQVQVAVPSGTLESVTLTDVLERGLVFDECQSLTASSSGLTTTVGTFADVCDNPTVTTEPPGSSDPADPGRRVTFDLGDVANGDASDATLTLTYDVVVLDSAQNERGENLRNAVTLTWSTGSLAAQAAAVTLVEPTLELTKTAAPTVALPGTEIVFTLTVVHATASDSDAFDLILQDVVPVGLIYLPGSLVSVSGQLPTSIDDTLAPTLRVGWDTFFDNGVNAVIEFRATLGNLGAGSSVTNSSLLEWSSLPGDVSAPQSSFNALSTERTYDPGSNVDIYGVTATATVRIPRLPETGFAPGRISVLPRPLAKAYRELGGLSLSIPALEVETPIVGVPRADGGWDLTWLADQAGYLEGTAFPTLPGNSALTGHVYLADGTPGPFVSLDELAWGDEVRVVSAEAIFVYAVRQVSHVRPENLNVLRHEEYPWLTLITCEGFDQAREAYARRVVVRAVLVAVEPR
jgi:LPXTG-site transpeptidase (sortase) family protein